MRDRFALLARAASRGSVPANDALRGLLIERVELRLRAVLGPDLDPTSLFFLVENVLARLSRNLDDVEPDDLEADASAITREVAFDHLQNQRVTSHARR